MRRRQLLSPTMSDSGDPLAANDDPLVLAMPRRELFRISGFCLQVDLGIIESVADDSWYGVASSLVGNRDAKEVRLGLVVQRGDHVLVDEAGALLQITRIGPEVARLGTGVKALRDLAQLAVAHFLGVDRARVELAGLLNEDSLPALRDTFVLVYRCYAPAGAATPAGQSWVPIRQLAALPLEPASIVVAAGLYPA